MNQVTAAFTTPEVNGSWNNWSSGTPMTDANGDGVWDATIHSYQETMNISLLLMDGQFKK